MIASDKQWSMQTNYNLTNCDTWWSNQWWFEREWLINRPQKWLLIEEESMIYYCASEQATRVEGYGLFNECWLDSISLLRFLCFQALFLNLDVYFSWKNKGDALFVFKVCFFCPHHKAKDMKYSLFSSLPFFTDTPHAAHMHSVLY